MQKESKYFFFLLVIIFLPPLTKNEKLFPQNTFHFSCVYTLAYAHISLPSIYPRSICQNIQTRSLPCLFLNSFISTEFPSNYYPASIVQFFGPKNHSPWINSILEKNHDYHHETDQLQRGDSNVGGRE